jgi:tetratricopeptide (TPR) repeat protein
MCVKPGTPEYYIVVQNLQVLTERIESGEDNGMLFLWRGGCYQEMQMLEAAAEEYTVALSYAPRLEELAVGQIYDSRSVVYFRLHRHQEAITDGEQAVHFAPKNARYWANLGRVYYVTAKYDKAFQLYNKAMELDPNDSWVLKFRAKTYDTMNQPKRVIEDLTQVLDIGRGEPTAILYGMRARNYLKLEMYEEAEQDCTTGLQDGMLERDLQAPFLFEGRAWARYHLGNYTEALADFMDAVRLRSDAPYSQLGLGLVFRALGGQRAAEEAFRRYAHLHPNGEVAALQEVALLLLKQGKAAFEMEELALA